jgi:hypothetical protein
MSVQKRHLNLLQKFTTRGNNKFSTYALTHGVELNQVQRIFDLSFAVYLQSYTYNNDK